MSSGIEGTPGPTGSVVGAGNVSGKPAEDFYTKQARLQADTRHALSQAKDMARLQMSNVRCR